MGGPQGAPPLTVGQVGVRETVRSPGGRRVVEDLTGHPGAGHGGGGPFRGQDAQRCGVGEQPLTPTGGEARVEGQHGRARLEHGQERDHQLRRPGQGEAHDALRPHPLGDEPVRQPVGPGVQFHIGQ
nr:hypothetical protein GCM10020241_57810 [Streptoalloteichus tenebrarius]